MTTSAAPVVRRARPAALAGAVAVSGAYFALVTWLCRLQYECFLYGFDLAWYGNLLASGSGKPPLYSTIHRSWFGDHFEPIGIFAVPLFHFVPSVWTLLVVQNLAFASIPLLCFLLARELLESDRLALLAALLSVVNPGLWYVNLDHFHWTVLTIPLTIAYFLALERRRSGWALAALGIMLLCKEDAALLVVPLCLAHYVTFRRARPALLAAGGAAAVFLIVNLCLMPAIGSPAPTGGWSYLGRTVGEIAANLLTRPGLLGAHLFTATNAEYLLELLLPFALLSVLDWRLWLAAPVALTFAASTLLPRHTVASQSAAMVIACVIVSGLYGLRRVAGRLPHTRRGDRLRAALLVGVLAVAVAFFARPMPEVVAAKSYVRLVLDGPSSWSRDELCPARDQLEAVVALVPDDPGVAVVAEGSLATHLVKHPWLQIYNWRAQPHSDYREFDLVVGRHRIGQAALRQQRRRRGATPDARREKLLTDPRWEETYSDANGWFVLRNRQPEKAARRTSPTVDASDTPPPPASS